VYLRELGLQLVVDVLEGAAEGGELPARLLGDEHLGHAVPVDRLAGLDRHVGHLLRAVPAHLSRPPRTQKPSGGSSLSPPPRSDRNKNGGEGNKPYAGGVTWRSGGDRVGKDRAYLVGSNGPR
jgi:hypothetical protein